MSIRPFRFTPSAALALDLRQRLARRRAVSADPDAHGRLGIAAADLERLAMGLAQLDWQSWAARVNRHAAFLSGEGSAQLHFVHERSAAAAAVPLLLLHGWPGSYLEFSELIAPLTRGAPAFHVVCPSLPGFAFSARDLAQPCDIAAMAASMAQLMQDLGYARYLVQGGDWGSVLAAQLARQYPQHCLGVHLNMAAMLPPAAADPVRAAVRPQEAAWLEEAARFVRDGMGYYAIQSTRPQTLAVALGDSPFGLLAWLAEKYLAWSDRDAQGRSLVSDAAIIDQVALYWATGSIGSSMRLYYDEAHASAARQRVSVATGVAVFPRELLKTPRAWVEQKYNLVHWTLQPRGGHFAALEAPDLLIEDVRAFTERALKAPQ
jgi:pimeloyl-ACP methyl ester carboxylesterase